MIRAGGRRTGAVLALAALGWGGGATAVGLGPLSKAGLTDGPAKAFYLTLYNPYAGRTEFIVYAVGADDETPQPRVRTPIGPIPLPAQGSRKFILYAGGLVPGESYTFRVCAEKANDQESEIHARVCSRITARRVAAAGA